ncbi:putative transporter SVOPL isoform X2 [Stigmatopora argus]
MTEGAKIERVSAIYLQEVELTHRRNERTGNSAEPTFTVEEAVEHVGFGRFHLLLFVILGSANIVEAMEIMLLAVISPEIRCEWHLEDWQVALVSTMVFLGFMACGVLSGYVADQHGRRKVLVGGFVWSAYFSILTSFAPSYPWFIFLRSLVGCGVAAGSQGYVLKTEFIPSKYRAILLPVAAIFWMLGSVLIIFLGMLVVPTLGWRWMIRLSVVPSIFLLFLFRFIPESARFDVSAGNIAAAADTLRRIARMNNASLPPGRLAESMAKKRGRWKDLLTSTFRTTSLLLWYSWFVASLAYYGSVLSSSELLEKNLLCVTDGEHAHEVKRPPEDGRCYCIPFAQGDYHTLLISCLGEVSRETDGDLSPARIAAGGEIGSLSLTSDSRQHLALERVGSAEEFVTLAADVGHILPAAQHLHQLVGLHAALFPAALGGLHELHGGLHLHRRGLSHRIAFAGDGHLHFGQSSGRNDRSLHCAAVDTGMVTVKPTNVYSRPMLSLALFARWRASCCPLKPKGELSCKFLDDPSRENGSVVGQ